MLAIYSQSNCGDSTMTVDDLAACLALRSFTQRAHSSIFNAIAAAWNQPSASDLSAASTHSICIVNLANSASTKPGACAP